MTKKKTAVLEENFEDKEDSEENLPDILEEIDIAETPRRS